MSIPAVDDPVWNELPAGISGIICDGDEVVGIAFESDPEEIDDDEMNAFLEKVGMPPMSDV